MEEDHNPMQQFSTWFHQQQNQFPEDENNAMLLTTIGQDDFPKSRIVLLKKYTWEGFLFFTNYKSEKALAIQSNNKVTIFFNWAASLREVHISGYAEKIPTSASEDYFSCRPRGSQIGAWASPQSSIIDSRKLLSTYEKHFENLYQNKEIPKPEFWGGYLIKPTYFLFTEKKYSNYQSSEAFTLQENYSWQLKTFFTSNI